MKTLMALLFIALSVFQDSSKPIPEPDILGVPYWFDPTAAQLREIPQEKFEGKVSPFSLGTIRVRVKGGLAPYRVKATAPPVFVLGLPSSDDPARFILFRMKAEKNHRETKALTVNINPLKGTGSSEQPDRVKCVIRRLRDNSYIISPTPELAAGEYCFLRETGTQQTYHQMAFCFGLDTEGAKR